MKNILLTVILISHTLACWGSLQSNTSETVKVIKELHIAQVTLDQYKVLNSLFNEYHLAPDKIPSEIRTALEEFIVRSAKDKMPHQRQDRYELSLAVFTLAMDYSKNVPPDVLKTIVLREDLPEDFRSSAIEKLRRDHQNDALTNIGDTFKSSDDPLNRAFAVNAYLNLDKLNKDQVNFIIQELETGNSRAEVRIKLPPELQKLYRYADVNGRKKLDGFLSSDKVSLTPEWIKEIKNPN